MNKLEIAPQSGWIVLLKWRETTIKRAIPVPPEASHGISSQQIWIGSFVLYGGTSRKIRVVFDAAVSSDGRRPVYWRNASHLRLAKVAGDRGQTVLKTTHLHRYLTLGATEPTFDPVPKRLYFTRRSASFRMFGNSKPCCNGILIINACRAAQTLSQLSVLAEPMMATGKRRRLRHGRGLRQPGPWRGETDR